MTLALLIGNHELNHLISTYGYAIVFLVVGAESLGLLQQACRPSTSSTRGDGVSW